MGPVDPTVVAVSLVVAVAVVSLPVIHRSIPQHFRSRLVVAVPQAHSTHPVQTVVIHPSLALGLQPSVVAVVVLHLVVVLLAAPVVVKPVSSAQVHSGKAQGPLVKATLVVMPMA